MDFSELVIVLPSLGHTLSTHHLLLSVQSHPVTERRQEGDTSTATPQRPQLHSSPPQHTTTASPPTPHHPHPHHHSAPSSAPFDLTAYQGSATLPPSSPSSLTPPTS